MIRKEEVRPGIILRVLSDHLARPCMRLPQLRPSKRHGWGHGYAKLDLTTSERRSAGTCTGGYLWEHELGCMEIIINLNEVLPPKIEGIVEPLLRHSRSPFKPVRFDAQLSLPFQFDEVLSFMKPWLTRLPIGEVSKTL